MKIGFEGIMRNVKQDLTRESENRRIISLEVGKVCASPDMVMFAKILDIWEILRLVPSLGLVKPFLWIRLGLEIASSPSQPSCLRTCFSRGH